MRKILILLLLFLLALSGFSYKYFVYDSQIHYKNALVLRVINKDKTLENELSKSSINHYNRLISESNNIYLDFHKNSCKIDENKIILLANNLRFLHEHKLALESLSRLYNCNKKLYNGINESAFNLLDNIAFISSDYGDKKKTIEAYKLILKKFSGNKYHYFSLSQEELLKEEINRLEK